MLQLFAGFLRHIASLEEQNALARPQPFF